MLSVRVSPEQNCELESHFVASVILVPLHRYAHHHFFGSASQSVFSPLLITPSQPII